MTDGWLTLRARTPARVGLARVGGSVATVDHLAFQAAHAAARDAVVATLDVEGLADRFAAFPVMRLRSAAADRATYLRRPDLGRRLHPDARDTLAPMLGEVAVVVADGLSATAANRYAPMVVHELAALLAQYGVRIGLIALVEQGRVAVGDDLAQAVGAQAVVVLLGERPGLSAADSLGAYVTWRPGTATTDAERNCVSNIRDGGLAPLLGAAAIVRIVLAARVQNVTGVRLVAGHATAVTQFAKL